MHTCGFDTSGKILDMFLLIGVDAIDQILIGLIIKNKDEILQVSCPMVLSKYLKQEMLELALRDNNMDSVVDPDFIDDLLLNF